MADTSFSLPNFNQANTVKPPPDKQPDLTKITLPKPLSQQTTKVPPTTQPSIALNPPPRLPKLNPKDIAHAP